MLVISFTWIILNLEISFLPAANYRHTVEELVECKIHFTFPWDIKPWWKTENSLKSSCTLTHTGERDGKKGMLNVPKNEISFHTPVGLYRFSSFSFLQENPQKNTQLNSFSWWELARLLLRSCCCFAAWKKRIHWMKNSIFMNCKFMPYVAWRGGGRKKSFEYSMCFHKHDFLSI